MAKITFYCEGNEWVDTKVEGGDEHVEIEVSGLRLQQFGIDRMEITDIDIVQDLARKKGHNCTIVIKDPETGGVSSYRSEEIFRRPSGVRCGL